MGMKEAVKEAKVKAAAAKTAAKVSSSISFSRTSYSSTVAERLSAAMRVEKQVTAVKLSLDFRLASD